MISMSPIRVVLVEDHDLTRVAMRMSLQQHRNVQLIGEAANGVEGLRIIKLLSTGQKLVNVEGKGFYKNYHTQIKPL